MNRKERCVRAFVFAVLFLALTSFAAGDDSLWARWVPDLSSPTLSADATGAGHTLSHVQGNFYPAADDPVRGTYYSCGNTGGNNAQVTCPAMKSRTFALWFSPGSAHHGYTDYTDIECLLNNLSGLTIYSRYAENVLRVAFGKLNKDQFADQTSDFHAQSTVSVPLMTGVWQHLVFALEETGEKDGENTLYHLSVYVNGELCARETNLSVPPFETDDKATIGNVGGYSRSPFIGKMDDIRVYSRALSEAEAKQLYGETAMVRLIGHWPMERVDVAQDGSRTTPDVSGNGHALQLGSLVCLTNGVSGDGALFFNAGEVTSANEAYDSYALAANTVDTLGGDCSLTMWIKRDQNQKTPSGARLLIFSDETSIVGQIFIAEPGARYVGEINGEKRLDNCVVSCEAWSHLALVFQFGFGPIGGDLSKTGVVYRITAYLNGEKVQTSAWGTTSCAANLFLKKGVTLRLANYSSGIRPFRGTLDDVRWYAGRLTDEAIRAIYRGPAKVRAGADFSVSGSTAELSCDIFPVPANPVATGFAGEPVWSLVSAPAGGEGAKIANPKGWRTAVTLPVLGDYVFAVSNDAAGLSVADTVTVTRMAEGGTPPVVGASVLSQNGLCAVVGTTVGPDVSVAWSTRSGPGAVWFGRRTSAKTSVTFSEPGDYVLRCTVQANGASVAEDLEISVSGASISEQLAYGLGAYWPFSLDSADNAGLTKFKDRVANSVMSSSGNLNVWPEAGAGGGYGISLPREANGALLADYKFSEGSTTVDGNTVPREPFTTMSVWMYHDSADTNNVWMGTMLCCSYMMAFHYHCDGGAANDFEIVSADNSSGNAVIVRRSRWKGPAGVNFTNRWVHVVFQLDQHNSGQSEVWVNGEKLTDWTGDQPRYQRYYDRAFCYGGNTCYAEVDPGAATTSYKFPGRLDEIRMYRRKLTESEIRYLYEYASPEQINHAPDVMVPASPVVVPYAKSTTIQATVKDDGVPAGGTLTYGWKVLEGDGASVDFSETGTASANVTVWKLGSYTLQLVASDGVRTTYSDPVVVNVTPPGLKLIIR